MTAWGLPIADSWRRARQAALAALVLIGPLAHAAPCRAQAADSTALDGRIVRRVQLVTHNIFDPLPAHGGTLYSLANRAHVRTQPATLRAALVFREGGRWTEAQRDESERHLRALAFLVPDSVAAFAVGQDSVDVRVVTHDNWTTSPEFSIESGGGQNFSSFSFVERNLLGLGTSLSLAYRNDVTGISRIARMEDGEILGSHWRGRATWGTSAGGRTNGLQLQMPFWSDDAPSAYGLAWTRDNFDTQLFAQDQLAATFPGSRETVDLFAGTGRRAADGTIQRFVASFEMRDRALGSPALQPAAPPAFSGPVDDVRIRRLAGEMRLWRPHYIVRRGVEQMDRDEDFDVGPSLQLKTGFSPHALGSTADEGFWRARVDLGRDAGALGFGLMHASMQARVRSGLREAYLEGAARWMQQPRTNLTAVVAVMGASGRDMPRDFQLTLGGVTGLRAYPVHELTGTGASRANAELRWIGARDWLRLVSLGAAAFWDGGRTWGPGSDAGGWLHDAGCGVRLSLPHSALNAIARFDVAWPLTTGPEGRRGPAFSFGSGQSF